jgi:hypothetical protein
MRHPANLGPMSIIEYQSLEDAYEAHQYMASRPFCGPPAPRPPPTELERKESRFSGLCGVIRMWRRAEKAHGPHEIRDKWRDKYLAELDDLAHMLIYLAPLKHNTESISAWRDRSGGR